MRGIYRAATLAVLLVAAALGAQDPAPVVVPAGEYADLTIPVPAGSKIITRVTPTPVKQSKDLPPGRVVFVGKPGTTYTVRSLVVNFKTEEISDTDYPFVFAGPTLPPPVVPPPGTDPKPPTGALYFMVIRANGPAAPDFTTVMRNAAWDTLRTAGHSVGDKTVSEARLFGLPTPATLPAVVTLRAESDHSVVVRPAVPLPTTSEGILALPAAARRTP